MCYHDRWIKTNDVATQGASSELGWRVTYAGVKAVSEISMKCANTWSMWHLALEGAGCL